MTSSAGSRGRTVIRDEATTLRLTDLFPAEVVGADGRSAGTVREVRAAVETDEDGVLLAMRVTGLIVGRSIVGERFGYAYGQARGPAILAAPMRWLARHARYVDWSRLVGWSVDRTGGRIEIDARAEDLPSAVPTEEAEAGDGS